MLENHARPQFWVEECLEAAGLGLDSDGDHSRPLATAGVAWAVSLDSQIQTNLRVCKGHQLCKKQPRGQTTSATDPSAKYNTGAKPASDAAVPVTEHSSH